jgi:hypothetical protein
MVEANVTLGAINGASVSHDPAAFGYYPVSRFSEMAARMHYIVDDNSSQAAQVRAKKASVLLEYDDLSTPGDGGGEQDSAVRYADGDVEGIVIEMPDRVCGQARHVVRRELKTIVKHRTYLPARYPSGFGKADGNSFDDCFGCLVHELSIVRRAVSRYTFRFGRSRAEASCQPPLWVVSSRCFSTINHRGRQASEGLEKPYHD